MKRFFLIFSSALVIFGLNSCSLDDDDPNFHFEPLQIISAELPESFELNRTYEINVKFLIPDGCTFFDSFDVSREDTTTRRVVAFGAVLTDQEVCTQAVQEGEATFRFVVLYNETYVFRFWQGNPDNPDDGEDEFFEVEVPVN